MQNHTLGEMIRDFRKRAGFTQEQLSEGICSPVTISRIETGVQRPSRSLLDAILFKLGTGTYQICDVYYQSKQQRAFEAAADQAAEYLRLGNTSEASKAIDALEQTAASHPLNLQYYLLLKASLLVSQANPAEDTTQLLKTALEITKPGFDDRDFRGVLLSVREANILSLLVVSQFRLHNTLSAIALGEELSVCLSKHQSTLKAYHLIRINVAINLAQCLEQERRYSEAYARCVEAESLSLETQEHALLPEIQFLKAKTLHRLGKDEESRAILSILVPYMELIQKKELSKLARAYATKELHLDI